MSISNTLKKTTRSAAPNLSNIRVRRSKPQTQPLVPMLSQQVAPAGTYASRIAAVTASKIESTNADAVDVIYELTGDDGKVVSGRVRYKIGGYHLEQFLVAMGEAGVPVGSPITDVIGVEEEIEIIYPWNGSLAKIKSRRPLEEPDEMPAPKQKPVSKQKPVVKHQASAPAADDGDDDFDDFLEDDEDDI